MTASAIEAHEGRDLATIDIPGAYLHTESNEEVIVILKGRLEELLVNKYPKLYMKYVVLEKGFKLLYMRLQKVLYRFPFNALLFYLKLEIDLKNIFFIINIYKPCVVNKLVNGEMMKTVWQDDDLKVSH